MSDSEHAERARHAASRADLERLLERAETQARIFDITLSSITDFVYIFDLDGRFRYVNKALLDLWGLTLDQVVGKNFQELKYPEPLASRLQRQIQQVIDTGKGLSDEAPYTSPTGASGYYEYIFRPVFAPDGSVEVVAGSTRDVSARKRTEDALRSRTAQFESLFSDVPLGVYLVDADFRVREVNPRARPVFANIPDPIGRDFDEVIHLLRPKPYADEVVRLVRRTLETGEPHITPERMEERRDLQKTEIYEWQIHRIPLPDARTAWSAISATSRCTCTRAGSSRRRIGRRTSSSRCSRTSSGTRWRRSATPPSCSRAACRRTAGRRGPSASSSARLFT
jgi:PAS domain S-box-containing protein